MTTEQCFDACPCKDWQPIESAPKDGSFVKMREGELAPFTAYWAGGRWRYVEFQHSNRPTHWRPL
jgi:hypothetical protein